MDNFYQEAISFILDLAFTARKEGLLALEEHAEFNDSLGEWSPLNIGKRLIIDGTDAADVEDILVKLRDHYLKDDLNLAPRHDGWIFHELARIGILGVQSGLNPRMLNLKLQAALPLVYRKGLK
jgi:flagellar motor component MotA